MSEHKPAFLNDEDLSSDLPALIYTTNARDP